MTPKVLDIKARAAMDPSIPPSSPFVLENPNRCPGNAATSAAVAVLPLRAAAEPPSQLPSSTPPDVGGGSYPAVSGGRGGASCALPARRRRTQDDATDQSSPAATDMIGRFQTIIKIVESRAPPAMPRPEIGELLKAVQCLKLPTGEPRHHQQKRCRRSPVSPAAGGRSSVSLLQETIAAIEQMRLSEPVENSEEYAEVLGKLKDLLRTQELEDG
ncbi:hypothetical protein Taro_023961 [Colocasia esculenta]|uniref:Uncharacterized protein n=1 Tax=Colocasia esculenta TaxID=4460 RepID=A0A843V7X6_COLES|nr:hypothetical protein [Colocasia esculenta]